MANAGLTTHFAFIKSTFSTYPWHVDYWEALDAVDAALNVVSGLTNVTGVWANSTVYTVGQRAIDNTTGTVYECAVGHTSASTGTFADDRTSNPSYWASWNANGIAADIGFTPAGNISSSNVQDAIEELDDEKITGDSPSLTGTPSAPTASGGTDTTQIATTAFVQQELDSYQPLFAELDRVIAGTTNEVSVADGDGASGNPTIGIADDPVLPGTGAVTIPVGTTAQRPGTPTNGMLRYNTSLDCLEMYIESAWRSLAGRTEQIEVLVAGENLADGDLCYLHSDGKFWKVDADAEGTADTMLAIARDTIAADASGPFLIKGHYTTSGLTAGAILYVSPTAGQYTETAPSGSGDIVRVVGYAISATDLFFNPSADFYEVA